MVAVVQVNGDFVSPERSRGDRQTIAKANDFRMVVKVQNCGRRIPAVEAPDIGRRVIRMKGMEARSCFQLVLHIRWEFIPPLVISSFRLATRKVASLGWSRVQFLRDCWKWRRESIEKGCCCRTASWSRRTNRWFRRRSLSRKCESLI